MKLSCMGECLLKEIEQLRLWPYDDQTGRDISAWVEGATIGYGHHIAQEEWFLYVDGINEQGAEELFLRDLAPFVAAVDESIHTRLATHQFDALVILAFNIGDNGFRISSAVKLINDPAADTPYETLELAWKAWKKSRGEVKQGLINRRAAEWRMYSEGLYGRW